ncbi:tautomerase family protein [Actinacidiphila oryziradicis]|uniref:tautomerase family protein n=1 Tax=Actinacidiphila oryziradicis TaxID=2571141 RepID=UPI0023F09445|nr:tautomerase family protein [Actinacidiphila oryziradicis]
MHGSIGSSPRIAMFHPLPPTAPLEKSAFIRPVGGLKRHAARRAQKERLYALLAERLRRNCGLDPADLIVSVTENDDEDWSFGSGRAQFLTGELR